MFESPTLQMTQKEFDSFENPEYLAHGSMKSDCFYRFGDVKQIITKNVDGTFYVYKVEIID